MRLSTLNHGHRLLIDTPNPPGSALLVTGRGPSIGPVASPVARAMMRSLAWSRADGGMMLMYVAPGAPES